MLPPREQGGNPQIRALRSVSHRIQTWLSLLHLLRILCHPGETSFSLDTSVSQYSPAAPLVEKACIPSKGCLKQGAEHFKLPTAQLGAGAQLFQKTYTLCLLSSSTWSSGNFLKHVSRANFKNN